MKKRKVLAILLSTVMVLGMLTGCGSAGTSATNGEDASQNNEQVEGDDTAKPFYQTLAADVTGSINIMTWNGDGIFHEDIGHWEPDLMTDLTSGNVAGVYAMAKKFNEMYPNVKINLYAKVGGSNDNIPWEQEMENFKAEHGNYPDIFSTTALTSEIEKGIVGDFSMYADDPMYQSFNPAIMNLMNYYGMQGGLPQYVIPWGVFVNKELAEDNNIDVPDPDWTMDEYTEFVTSADNTSFWGVVYGQPTQMISTGTDTVTAAMYEYKEIDLCSDQVMDLLSYIPQWSQYEIWTKYNAGAIDDAIMDDAGRYGYGFFCRNYCLTYAGDPWKLNDAGMGKLEDGSWADGTVESGDWDIYPRPSTDYRENNVGIVIDPMAIRNIAMEDGDPAMSDTEKAKMDLAYAFGSYWCGSTEAMQARADQQYNSNGTLKSSLSDSFPLVTGEAFDEQMKIWYSIGGHKRYADAELMPGFHYVMELWEKGNMWDVADKCYPMKVNVNGSQESSMVVWEKIQEDWTTGISSADATWLDAVKANMPDWNEYTKSRLQESQENLKTGLKTYYGFTDSDF